MTARGLTDLRALLARLEQTGELRRVSCPVDPDQELPEIHRGVIAAGGPALFFERVVGSPYPVVTNLFGTRRRVDIAFGLHGPKLIAEAAQLASSGALPNWKTLLKHRTLPLALLRLGTRTTRRASVTAVCDQPPRLTELPFLKVWPDDGGFFMTLPLVFTADPETGVMNLGMYRLQRYDDTTTGMHWQLGKGGGFHYHHAEQRGQSLPVAVATGGAPALTLGAITPLPEGVPEMLLASLVAGQKLPVWKEPLTGYHLPANSEFVLAGEVPPQERRPEGPFGDHYGYYSLQHDYPVFHCQRVYHRRDAIYPATVVGKPRQEDYYIGEYLQDLLRPLMLVAMPAVRDLWAYPESGFHPLLAATVRDRYPREALIAGLRILGEGQLSLTKVLLLTDQLCDLKNIREVLSAILSRSDEASSLVVLNPTALDSLDYSGPAVNRGSKLIWSGVGAQKRHLPEGWQGDLPAPFTGAQAFSPGCLVVSGADHRSEPGLGQQAAQSACFADWPLVVLCDQLEAIQSDQTAFLWSVLTRFDPARDLYARHQKIVDNSIRYEYPIVWDARWKDWYPAELSADPAIATQVRQRWSDYFPAGDVTYGGG